MTNFFVITRIFFVVFLPTAMVSCHSVKSVSGKAAEADEKIYLAQIRNDFIQHKEDVATITAIAGTIVKRIDSLFNGLRKDTSNADLVKGIMTTRPYDMTILAYKNILNGNYIRNAELKLKVARHVAWFEGIAESKRHWDNQWDETARPYIYNNALFKPDTKQYNLIADPTFRTILFDRRMFAHDAEIYGPRILESADSILAAIDMLTNKE
jgi:hypothetical protein